MDLLEYQGKELFRKHGIPTPAAAVFAGEQPELPGHDRLVVKAQIPAGKREEHGGITVVDHDNALDAARKMQGDTIQGHTVNAVLLEEAVDIADEYYLSLSIDRAGKGYRLVFSQEGGSGIEDRRETATTLGFYQIDKQRIATELADDNISHADRIAALATQMFDLMRQEDALLVEINPLVLTEQGDLVAVDSKVRIDDSALYRHDIDTDNSQDDQDHGLEFVDLDGSIGVIGNGAGLVMATLDSINHFGGRPANFLDIGGGADIETMTAAMETVLDQDGVDGLFINIFGGITRCDHVAQGIIDFVDEEDIDLPLVVRMVGTNQEEGKKMLKDHGIEALDSMDDCARSIVEMTGGENDADR